MKHDLLSRGIYAIINKQLKMVYVGETERSFLIRWVEHINRIPEYADDPKRIHLYLNKETKFIILKKMDNPKYHREDFYRAEYEAREFYIKKDWEVLSKHNYNPTSKYDHHNHLEKLIDRYRKAVTQMAFVLSAVNTKHTNGSLILYNLYIKVEQKFNTDLANRVGKNPLHKLTFEELEFILLEMYPRFYHKKLDLLRNEYKHIKVPKNLFDFNN